MSSSGSSILIRVDDRSVGELSVFILVLLVVVGIFPMPVTRFGVNLGLLDLEIFVEGVLLVICFLPVLGPVYLLFGASV